jgi:hypothetical protein
VAGSTAASCFVYRALHRYGQGRRSPKMTVRARCNYGWSSKFSPLGFGM